MKRAGHASLRPSSKILIVRIFEEGRRGMKRPGLPTQNQRNKRKDGEADRWPDASFFPLTAKERTSRKNLFPSYLLSNGEGKNLSKEPLSFLPIIKRRRKEPLERTSFLLTYYQTAKERTSFPHRNKKASNATRCWPMFCDCYASLAAILGKRRFMVFA